GSGQNLQAAVEIYGRPSDGDTQIPGPIEHLPGDDEYTLIKRPSGHGETVEGLVDPKPREWQIVPSIDDADLREHRRPFLQSASTTSTEGAGSGEKPVAVAQDGRRDGLAQYRVGDGGQVLPLRTAVDQVSSGDTPTDTKPRQTVQLRQPADD